MENNIDNWGYKEFFIAGIVGAVLIACLVLIILFAPLVLWYIFIGFVLIALTFIMVILCVYVGIGIIWLFRLIIEKINDRRRR